MSRILFIGCLLTCFQKILVIRLTGEELFVTFEKIYYFYSLAFLDAVVQSAKDGAYLECWRLIIASIFESMLAGNSFIGIGWTDPKS